MQDHPDNRRYKILEVLGKGGFGTVYRAQLHGSGGFRKDVALKVLNPDVASSTDVVRRLRDEARMLGMLRHRAIVNVDALAQIDGRWTIVMEYVDGVSLRDVLGGGAVPVGAALEVVEEVSAALDVAFNTPGAEGRPLGLLHRDIKPGNVQITARGEVKLLDFGVAKADFGDREAHTRSLIFGSVNYLAPERLDFEDTHKGDVYALGCTLYEMLVGEQLDKASVNPRKHRDKVNVARREVLRAHNDPDLAALVERCLEYEPDARPDARALERQARALHRAYPEPWFKDWAERAVPQARARRSTQDDAWSGSLVHESGKLANDTLSLFADPNTHAEDTVPPDPPAVPPAQASPPPLSAETDHPPAPARQPAAAPPPLARARGTRARDTRAPRKRGRALRWFVGISLTLLVLLIAIPVVAVIATGGGLYALLTSTGIWQQAWDETITDNMAELHAQVRPCSATLERDEILALLTQAQTPGSGDNVSLLELVEFETLVEKAAGDLVIDEVEVVRIQEAWQRITAD